MKTYVEVQIQKNTRYSLPPKTIAISDFKSTLAIKLIEKLISPLTTYYFVSTYPKSITHVWLLDVKQTIYLGLIKPEIQSYVPSTKT